jgi:hypothetical protein
VKALVSVMRRRPRPLFINHQLDEFIALRFVITSFKIPIEMAEFSSEMQIIPLAKMPQQAGLRKARDDWIGIINRKERRKLQNRLNQRRYRVYIGSTRILITVAKVR